MPDLFRIKQNVSKMVNAGAPEQEIDSYISMEGTTVDDIKNVRVNPQFTKIAESPDVQRMAHLLRTMPFYRRGAALMSGKSLEEIDRTLNAIPEPEQNLGNALFKALPDIAMASPVFKGVGAIPKIWPVAKTALGLGAYGGARAAGQNQPVLPAVAQGAAFGTLGHGLGRAATTVLPKIPLRGNIGSAMGWGATGAALSPEDRLQGAAFGAGMGLLSPSKPLQRPYFNEIAGHINNSLMKSTDLNKALLYGDPGKGIAREGLTGKNLKSLKKNVETKLTELNQTANQAYANNKTKLADYKVVFSPLVKLRNKLMEHPLDNKTAINRLDNILQDISGISTGKQRSFTNLNPLEARRLKQEIDTFTDWNAVGKGDHEINIALKKTYHNVDTILDTNVPQLRQLNDRIKDLISADKAIDVNIRKGKSVDIIPENWWELANIPFRSVKSVAFKTNLARALAQRYPQTQSWFSPPLKNIPTRQGQQLPYSTKQLPYLGRAPYKPMGYPGNVPPQKPLITPYKPGGPVIRGQLPPRQSPQGKPLTAAEAVKQGMGAEEWVGKRNPNIDFSISENDKRIKLNKMIVPVVQQRKGLGTKAVNDLIKYADSVGKRIELTPGTDYGATSKQRLINFYKRFGFYENKGKARDFSTKESMIRDPLSSYEAAKGVQGQNPLRNKSGQTFKGLLGPTMATGVGLAAALKATVARGETGESLDPKYKQQIANAENYGKVEGDWAQVEDIVIRDLKRIGKLKQNITLEQVKKDPQLYDKVVKMYWDRLDAFGIPEKDKALWWLMPGRYRQTGGDISRLKNPEHRNIMQNRVKNIRGRK